jgi:hypothetical protein
METTKETLPRRFAALHDLLTGIEHRRKSWHDFWPPLADIHSVIQQRQPQGSLAGSAMLQLYQATAAGRSRDVERARIALQNAEVTLKLSDTTAAEEDGK